jgi:hypothetical protein
VRRPDVLLLDGARVLTDGLEVHAVLPQTEAMEATEIFSLASGIAASSGSPWGRVFPASEHVPPTEGAFDGETASTEIGGMRYFVGPSRIVAQSQRSGSQSTAATCSGSAARSASSA